MTPAIRESGLLMTNQAAFAAIMAAINAAQAAKGMGR